MVLWGEFEIPEYQINQRMISTFHNENNALAIRQFYVKRLQELIEKVERLHLKESNGILTEEDLATQEKLIKKQEQLLIDWYDIHSNYKLSSEHARIVLLKRLQEEGKETYQLLVALFEQEKPHIKQILKAVREKIHQFLDCRVSVNDSGDGEILLPPERPPIEAQDIEEQGAIDQRNPEQRQVVEQNFFRARYGLFTSKNCDCLAAKEKLVEISRLKLAIN